MGGHGRAAAVPAWDRHSHRRRTVRRDRRLRSLCQGQLPDQLPRAGPQREDHRTATPPRRRSPSPDRATPAGCWSKRPGTTAAHPRSARRSSAASATKTRTSSRLPGRPNNASTAPGNTWTPSAANAAPSSRSPSPASLPGSCWAIATPTSHPLSATSAERGGGTPAPTRESTREMTMSSLTAATLDVRQRALTTKPGPAATRIRAYQSDRASRTRAGPAAPSADTMPAPAAGIWLCRP